MKTIIAGSRTILDVERVFRILDEVEFTITEVVCGLAKGVDNIGKEWANQNGILVKEFPADWKKLGLSAGPKRNQQMAEYGEALILIWDGQSTGSMDMLKRAKSRGLRVLFFNLSTNSLFD